MTTDRIPKTVKIVLFSQLFALITIVVASKVATPLSYLLGMSVGGGLFAIAFLFWAKLLLVEMFRHFRRLDTGKTNTKF